MKYFPKISWIIASCAMISVSACGSTTPADVQATDGAGDGTANPDATAADSTTDAGQDSVITPDSGIHAGPLALQPGQVAELAVSDGVSGIELQTPLGTEQYVAIVASTRVDKLTKSYTYSLDLLNAPDTPSYQFVSGCAIDAAGWATATAAVDPVPQGDVPPVGTLRTLQMSTSAGMVDLPVELTAVGKRGAVWVDVSAAHPANVDPAVVADFLKDFDEIILPRERAAFGMESDLDKDGHVGLVFTSLTKDTAVAFFSGCDLQALPGCNGGNQGEFLYLNPPANLDPPYNTPAAIKETLAHECGHLVHFNRKVLRNQLADWNDSSYMIEGFGALAQDVIGFQAGNLYVAMAGLDGINDFSLAYTLMDKTSYNMSKDGVLRGMSYWFTRWLYDRAGGDAVGTDGALQNKGGPAFVQSLLGDKATVATAKISHAQGKSDDIAMDFYTTLAVSNREDVGGVVAENPCLRMLPIATDPVTQKQRGANVYAKFHGMAMKGPKIQDAAKADGKLLAGGVEYVLIKAEAGQAVLDWTVQSDPTAQLRVRIARIQ